MIIAFILVGIALRRLKSFPDETSQVLNLMVIWVALPAVIFIQAPKIEFSSSILIPALTPWAMILVFAALTLLMGKLMKWGPKTLGALLLLAPLGNTSFLGIPMVKTFFGAEAIPIAIIYDQVGSFLGLGIYGVIIVSVYASGEKLQWKKVGLKAITFPPFVAMILAFLLAKIFKSTGSSYHPSIQSILEVLGATLVPMAMMAVGFQLKLKLSKSGYLALGFGLISKLILAPVLLWSIFQLLGWNHQVAQVTIFEAAMPPMITAGAISISSGLDEDLSASMVGLGIFLSLITLPLMNGLIAS